MYSELRHVYKILRRLAVNWEEKEMWSKNVNCGDVAQRSVLWCIVLV